MKTTLNAIRAHRPCADGWFKLLKHLSTVEGVGVGSLDEDKPMPIATILYSNGISDALWCLRAVKGYDRELSIYAAWCKSQAEKVAGQPLNNKGVWSTSAGLQAWGWASAWSSWIWAINQEEEAKSAQAAELLRVCREIEAGRDPYPEGVKP